MRSPIPKFALPALLLFGFIACGGGDSNPPTAVPSQGLTYTDPSGSGWRLVKDGSSTPTHVVLNLLGPSTSKSRGVGFNLEGGGAVKFGRYSNGGYIQAGEVYELFNSTATVPGSPDDAALLNGGVIGTMLTVGIFQKDRHLTAKDHTAPLLQIAVDFDPARTKLLSAGTEIPLSIMKAKIIPEDIGDLADWSSMIVKSKMEPITIALGALKTQ